MSSTFNVADSSDDKDGSLILYVNVDGTINVDQETLNKIMANQYDTGNVSVVRVDDNTAGGENVNLMIERFGAQQLSQSAGVSVPADTTVTTPTHEELPAAGDVADVVIDPFSQMDPEQLEKLENALQSEQAKEILGTNLEDNLLEMLEGGGDSCRVEDSAVHNDHSYTTPLSSPMKQHQSAQAKPSQATGTPPKTPQTVVVSTTAVGTVVTTQPATSQPVVTLRGGRVRNAKAAAQVGLVTTVAAPTAAVVSSTTKAGNIVLARPAQQLVRPAGVVPRGGRAVATGNPTQRFIIKRGTKIVASATSNGVVGSKTPKILQRRVLAQKVAAAKPGEQAVASPDPTTLAAQSLVQMAAELQTISGKKETPPRKAANKGGRKTPKGGKNAAKSVAAEVVSPTEVPTVSTLEEAIDDEMALALEAMHAGIQSPQASPTKQTPHNKKTPPAKAKKEEEPKKAKTTPHTLRNTSKRLKSPEAQGIEDELLKCLQVHHVESAKVDATDEGKKKKDKVVKSDVVLGPELFSHPDIIRRVSVDKHKDDGLSIEEKLEHIEEAINSNEPLPPPLHSNKASDHATESLLNSLTDVTKEESNLLVEALLLDDLTNEVLGSTLEPKDIKEIIGSDETVKTSAVAPHPAEDKKPPLKQPAQKQQPQKQGAQKQSAQKQGAQKQNAQKQGVQRLAALKLGALKVTSQRQVTQKQASPKTAQIKSPAELKSKKKSNANAKNNSPSFEIRKLKSPHLNKKVVVVIKDKKAANALRSPPSTAAQPLTPVPAAATPVTPVAAIPGQVTTPATTPTTPSTQTTSSAGKRQSTRKRIPTEKAAALILEKEEGVAVLASSFRDVIETKVTEPVLVAPPPPAPTPDLPPPPTPAPVEPPVLPPPEPTPVPEPEEQPPEEEEENAESDVESFKSEDDPDRLWCICKKPHNNRFMICCDTCEDWFHGKCVGITKALGHQMEAQGIEWSCPNCKQAKEAISKTPAKAKPSTAPPKPPATSTPKTTPAAAAPKAQQQKTIGSVSCVNCQKPAKAGSSYCCDVCVKKHVLERLIAIKHETHRLQNSSRVVVLERRSGKVLMGDNAPTADCLLNWILEHPTFEVVEPSTLPNYVKIDQPKPIQPKPRPGSLKQMVLATKSIAPGIKQLSFAPKTPVTIKTPTTPSPTTPTTPTTSKVPVKSEAISTTKFYGKAEQATTPKGAAKHHEHVPAKTPIKKEEKEVKIPAPKRKSSLTPSVEKDKKTPKSPPPTTPPIVEKKVERKRRESESKPTVSSTTKTEPSNPKQTQQPIRANVKRTLQELLHQRIKDDPELKDTNPDQIKELSAAIEEELFKVFNDTGAKYKSKYRSLVFNIKDPKNLTLYKKIVEKFVSPSQLVRLTPEELASQELAQWREKEAKHQLEIIKKNELDLIHQAKTVVLKSRKGEEVIESKPLEKTISELESALNRTADDVEEDFQSKRESTETKISDEELLKLQEKLKLKDKDEKNRDKKKDKKHHSRSRSRTRSNRSTTSKKSHHRSRSRLRSKSHHRSRSRHRSKSHHRSRSRHRSKSHHRSKSRHRSNSRQRSKSRHNKEKRKEEKPDIKEEEEIKDDFMLEDVPLPPEEPEFLDEPSLETPEIPIKEDSDIEPTSTVTIATPPYPPEEEEDKFVWSGTLNMVDVTKLQTKAHQVSGCCENLDIELADNLECVGRIQPESVWDYISRMKKSGTKEIVVVRFSAESEEEKMNYLALYSYLSSRNRMAVIGNVSRTVKDFYVFPLASHSPIPQVLLPLDGPGFDDYRPHLLLGIIIRTRKLKIVKMPETYSVRSPERSYTPPLPTDAGCSPPVPKVKPHRGITPPLLDDDEPYEPGDDSPYTPEDDSVSLTPVSAPIPDIQKNLEEVNRMIEQKKQQLESLTAQHSIIDSKDDDAYSPGSYTPPRTSVAGETIPFLDSKTLPSISIPSNLQDILASIKSPVRSASPSDSDSKLDSLVKAYSQELQEDDSVSSSGTSKERWRDPRKGNKGGTLSQLSENDLMRKAAELGFVKADDVKYDYPVVPPPDYPVPVTPDYPVPVTPDYPVPVTPDYSSTPLPPVPYYPPIPPQVQPPPQPPPPPYQVPPPLPPPAYRPPDPPAYRPTRSPPPYNRAPSSPPPYTSTAQSKKRKTPEPEGRFEKRSRGQDRKKWDVDMRTPDTRSGAAGLRGPNTRLRGPGPHQTRFPPRGGPQNRGFNYNPRFNNRSSYFYRQFDGGIQSEWDEEIRNFEQRKSKEAAERRKRRSRSPSPPRKSRNRRSPPRT